MMKTKKQSVNGMLCKPLTLEEARNLKYGDTVYFRKENDSRGALRKVKVNGQVKTWKRDTERVQVPWKYGLRDYGYITESYLDDWTLESEPYERFKDVRVCPCTSDEMMLSKYTRDFIEDDSQLKSEEALMSLVIEIDNSIIHNEDVSYELYEVLPSLMQKFAPDGYYYGTHESDGEWGYWPIPESEEE